MNDTGTETPIPELSFKEAFFWMLGRRKRFIINGTSMLPLLKSGDQVLVAPLATLATGDVIVINHPFKKSVIMVKRLTRLCEDGFIEIHGTGKTRSTDSDIFGKVPVRDVIGKVTARMRG